MARGLAVLLFVLAPTAARAQCDAVGGTASQGGDVPGLLRIHVVPRSPPSHGSMGMEATFPIELENLTDRALVVELVQLHWVTARARDPLRRLRMQHTVGGRTRSARVVTVPARARLAVVLEGRARWVYYHEAQWHEATLRVGRQRITVAGCGHVFRHPHTW